MKKIFTLIFCVFLLTACESLDYNDPLKYNNHLAVLVIRIQTPLDSLHNMLLTQKFAMQDNLQATFNPNDFDSQNAEDLLLEISKATAEAQEVLQEITFAEGDEYFKPALKKSLPNLENIAKENFEPIVEILKKSENKSNLDVIYEILEYGKRGYLDYQATMDTIIIGQYKFKMENKINDNMFNLKFRLYVAPQLRIEN